MREDTVARRSDEEVRSQLIKRFRELPLAVHGFLLFLLLFPLAWYSLSVPLFFISDTGLRFLQIRELITQDWGSFAIQYPGRIFDPELRHVPYYYASRVVDQEIYVSVTHFFPLVTSFFYRLLGTAGLAILPVSGTVLTAAAVAALARLAGAERPALLLWATVLATPFLFYSLTLWDHTIAAACSAGAIFLIAHGLSGDSARSLGLAGALLVLGFAQRVEVAVFALAVGGALLLSVRFRLRSALMVALGAIVATVPIGLLHYSWIGHPFGIVFAGNFFGYGKPEVPVYVNPGSADLTPLLVRSRLLLYVQGQDAVTLVAFLLVVIPAVLLILALRLERYRSKWLFYLALGSMALGYGLWMIYGWYVPLVGLLTVFPLFPLSFAYISEWEGQAGRQQIYRLVFLTTIFFVGGMVAIWPAYGGGQWGSRYLLPAYPLMIYLAFEAYDVYRERVGPSLAPALRRVAVGLAILSVALQLLGVRYLLFHVKAGQVAPQEARAALETDIILTNMPYLPSMMSSLADKTFLYIDDEADLEKLLPRIAAEGITTIAIELDEEEPLTVPPRIGEIELEEVAPGVYRLEREKAR